MESPKEESVALIEPFARSRTWLQANWSYWANVPFFSKALQFTMTYKGSGLALG